MRRLRRFHSFDFELDPISFCEAMNARIEGRHELKPYSDAFISCRELINFPGHLPSTDSARTKSRNRAEITASTLLPGKVQTISVLARKIHGVVADVA